MADDAKVLRWRDLAASISDKIPTWLSLGHIAVESGGNPRDESVYGESGLWEIHPGTLADLLPQMAEDQRKETAKDPKKAMSLAKAMYANLLKRGRKFVVAANDEEAWLTAYIMFAIGSDRTIEKGTGYTGPVSFNEFLERLGRHSPSSKFAKAAENALRVLAIGKRLSKV